MDLFTIVTIFLLSVLLALIGASAGLSAALYLMRRGTQVPVPLSYQGQRIPTDVGRDENSAR